MPYAQKLAEIVHDNDDMLKKMDFLSIKDAVTRNEGRSWASKDRQLN